MTVYVEVPKAIMRVCKVIAFVSLTSVAVVAAKPALPDLYEASVTELQVSHPSGACAKCRTLIT